MRPHKRPAGAHEKFQQAIFARRQFDVRSAALRPVRDRVQREVGHAQHGGFVFAAPPRQRPHPRDQFGQFKRLGQVIVRAGVQSFDALVDFAARGQEQDRCGIFALAQLAQHAQAVASRQHDVEHDAIEGRARAAARASSPLPQTSTAKPSACSALRTNDAVFFSSSTTSTRMRRL